MTLLITLASKSAIHQSSDYRLSCQGVPTETANGTKQLSINTCVWEARISFTGIANNGADYVTRDWIYEEGVALNPSFEPVNLVENLAKRGTLELRRVTNCDRRLSIVVAIRTLGGCKLFLVSNFEEPRKTPQRSSLGSLHLFEFELSSVILLVNGAFGAVPKSQKRILKKMFRENVDPKVLREKMAFINRLASSQRAFANTISQGCWVTSIFADGRSNSENYGEVPGTPYNIMSHIDMSGYVKSLLRPAPEQRLVLRQAASASGLNIPLPPEGEPRSFHFSTDTTSLRGIGCAQGTEYPRLTIVGRSGIVRIRKNESVKAVIATAILEIHPSIDDSCGSIALERQQIIQQFMINNCQVTGWRYEFDFHVATGTAVMAIRQSSVGLRTAQSCDPMFCLGLGEELLIAAHCKLLNHFWISDNCNGVFVIEQVDALGNGLFLTATNESPYASADIVASVRLHDHKR